jgi:predicted acylesterase/phospholipase RssA
MVTERRKAPNGRIQIGPKKKIALVCSGGAAKAGAFHLGVALALQEQGFKFYGGMVTDAGIVDRPPGLMEISTYVGSSAGSMISAYLAAGFSLDNIFNSYLSRLPENLDPADARPKIIPKLTYQKMLKLRTEVAREQFKQLNIIRKIAKGLMDGDFEAILQLKWLKATGLFSTSGIEQYLREEVLSSNRFQDCLADLFIVATQLNHSRKVVFGKTSYEPPPDDLTCEYNNSVGISQACGASTALPPIFAPYAIQGADGSTVHYIDGEIRDTLSTHVAIDAGADLVIASYTHQPYHLQKEVGSLTEHGLPAILIQSIYLLIEKKITHHIHNSQTKRNAILEVDRYCRESGVSDIHRKKIGEIMERELHHKLNVDTIYIHPDPDDTQMFFGDHFSLHPKKMSEVVRSGFRAAIDILRKYEFADRVQEPVIGTTGSNGT